MQAIRFERTGGPGVLELVDVPTPTPGPAEILVRHEAVGVNFIDIYHRTGLYPVPLPSGLGQKGAGVVEAIGADVTRFKVGDRAAYALGGMGAYAEYAKIAEGRAVRVPDAVDSKLAAAALLKGMTAEFLLHRCFPVRSGQPILVHAAAGGVGQILVQWAKSLGARVIATVRGPAKAEIATRLGADHVIDYSQTDVGSQVRRFTDEAGVAVVYDSVGKDTFEGSLASLARRGCFVSFGNASGPPPLVELQRLSRMGSLYVTRPTLADYVATTEELDASAAAVFERLAAGQIVVDIAQAFPLSEAAMAHAALEGRRTTGATLLLPGR